MGLPHDRFVIYDPETNKDISDIDGPLAAASLDEAVQFAVWEAQTRGHDLMVGDRMAHPGKTIWWRVSPSGEVTPQ
jgi:hypothetical protein